MKAHRLARVAEVVREVASETILFELQDPRVKRVTVTRTEVSGDLQHAKVFVSVMGTEKEQQLTLRGLRHAAGFVQAKLGRRLQTRFTPTIQFVLDQGVKHSIEISRLIHEALADKAPVSADSADSADSHATTEAAQSVLPSSEEASEAQVPASAAPTAPIAIVGTVADEGSGVSAPHTSQAADGSAGLPELGVTSGSSRPVVPVEARSDLRDAPTPME